MIQAMYSGIAGLNAFKSSLDIIGNNIANVNTVAYKSNRVTFKEALSQTLAGGTGPSAGMGGVNPKQIGLGVTVGSIDSNMSGGSPQATGSDTDLMINGAGYFVLSDGSKRVYSRDGSFALDAQNNLVSSSSGMKVMGWAADLLTGEVNTAAEVNGSSGISIPIGLLSNARATSRFNIAGNLNLGSPVGSTEQIQSPVYDSLGSVHNVDVVFTRANSDPATGESIWDYSITCPDASGVVKSGSITFGANGASKTGSIDIALEFAVPNGSAQPLNIKIDTSGLSCIGTIDGRSSVSLGGDNDGLPLGTLESYSIGQDGTITGRFSNSSSRPLGKIAIAVFTNPAGLSRLGNNVLSESPNSGTARIGEAGAGGRGLVSSGFLEASNVDLAQEFANMIIAQRGFQANSRIITTSDHILQELVQMKQ
ncbi:MAG: flagellar hook protein FlgE [Armatimonadota bacterium]